MARDLEKMGRKRGKQCRIGLHKIGRLANVCQLSFLYTIGGRGQLRWPRLEKVSFQKS